MNMKLNELLKQATPLPWRATALGGNHQHAIVPDDPESSETIAVVYDANVGDSALIAHAVNVLPKLVEALEATLKHYAPDALVAEDWVFDGNSQTDAVLRNARVVLAEANNPEVTP